MNLFDSIFTADSESIAILYEAKPIEYQKLKTDTLNLARVIASLGIKPQEQVALMLNDSPEFIQAFIAICSLGSIAVPINMSLRLSDQITILRDCGARMLLVEDDLRGRLLMDAQGETHFPELVVTVDRGRKRYQETVLDEVGSQFWITEERVNRPSSTLYTLNHLLSEIDRNIHAPFVAHDSAPAFILYTSGSTGEPKGAVHRQSDIYFTNATFCREVLGVRQGDRLFSSSRLPFAYGLGNSFTFPLLNKATTILCRDKPTPDVIATIFRECKPTIFFGVPVVYNLLLEYHARKESLDCSSLRLCVSAGEALPAHLGQQWEDTFAVKVLDGIGSTEMLHMFMSNHQQDIRYGSSGKVLKGYEARLLDLAGNPIVNGEGNLWVKGNSAAIGYWERPAETARTFVDGWVRTGDLYRCDEDGYWFHMGRSDDCFKSSGQWVSPVEVEGVLLTHDKVSRVAVVEDFDSDGLPCACAFVVSQDVNFDHAALENELREFVGDSLPRFKQPRHYRFVKELPYTATGKIQRFKLRQRLREAIGEE